jgi:excisionase family DNA binding protein
VRGAWELALLGFGPRGEEEMDRASGGAVATDRHRSSTGQARPGLDEPLLTVERVARLLAVKPGWVYTAVRDGVFPHVKVGKHLRFIRRDIEEWIFEHRKD